MQLPSYNSNLSTINSELLIPNIDVNVSVSSPTTVSIVVPVLVLPSSTVSLSSSSTEIMSSSEFEISSVICYSTSNSIPTSSTTTTVYVNVPTTITSCTATKYVALTTSVVSNCPTSPNRTMTVGTEKPPSKPDALSQEFSIPGGAIYFGIAGFVIVIIVILIFSICCCLFCYHKGQHKKQKMVIEIQRDPGIEMSTTNQLYEEMNNINDDEIYASINDEKKLLK